MDPTLEPKVQLLVALGAATAAKCQKCFTKLYGSTAKLDVSDTEVRAVVGIADKVVEKSHGYMADFIAEAMADATKTRTASDSAAAAGCGCP